jgi:hypothetical protein
MENLPGIELQLSQARFPPNGLWRGFSLSRLIGQTTISENCEPLNGVAAHQPILKRNAFLAR